MKKSFLKTKWFNWLLLTAGIIELLLVLHQICSYHGNIRPYLGRFIAENKTGNTVGGLNWLAYFTFISNFFVSVWLILKGTAELSSSRKLLKFIDNTVLRTAMFVYILATGLLYTISTFWYIRWFDASDGGAYFLNTVNILLHFVYPPLFVVYYFISPPSNRVNAHKAAAITLIFPAIYLVFSIVRGK